MPDPATISTYDAQAKKYAKLTQSSQVDQYLLNFISLVKSGGFVLDLGCGPADSSAAMRHTGLRVDPVDASEKMVELANQTHEIGARVAEFSDIKDEDTYDGVWANFSLLHADPADFPNHLHAIHTALVEGGTFQLTMKLGEGTKRDSLNRFYAYYSQSELSIALSAAGFIILSTSTGEALGMAGDIEPWITLTCQKPKT